MGCVTNHRGRNASGPDPKRIGGPPPFDPYRFSRCPHLVSLFLASLPNSCIFQIMIHFYSAGSGTPLIFLHGIGSTGRSWEHQLEQFKDDYLCIGLDLPGYGGSEPLPDNNFVTLSDWLKQAIDDHGWTHPILVGNSYGGMIIQEFLYLYPGIAKAAVLYGTSPAFGKKDGEWQQNYIRARLQPLDEGLTMVDLAPTIVKSLIGSQATEAGKAAAEADIGRVSEQAFRTSVVTLLLFDRRDNLPNITIPTLLLVGSEDRNAPSKMMAKTATYIPNAEFIELEGLGHIAHIEDPGRFNQALKTFLNVTVQSPCH
ncbi:MAG: 3-oxoadipate enol-lactonase [Candidatus Promineifilaceae bacterium]|jgi:3-oxoadipate enol-lactonase